MITIDYTAVADTELADINTELAAQTVLLEYMKRSVELNEEILLQLKINNAYFSDWTNETLTEEDIEN